mmetsp:Transcript_6919/g.14182  ORF Transcript_6919/g.14182 Transcript_6919/m.14182 type:complete len:129 (-) Transcript_6919:384-770(-)
MSQIQLNIGKPKMIAINMIRACLQLFPIPSLPSSLALTSNATTRIFLLFIIRVGSQNTRHNLIYKYGLRIIYKSDDSYRNDDLQYQKSRILIPLHFKSSRRMVIAILPTRTSDVERGMNHTPKYPGGD